MASSTADASDNNYQAPNCHPEEGQDARNHAEDLADVGKLLALGVHAAGANLFEVAAAHYPGGDSGENAAANETQDAEHQDQGAAVRRVIGAATPAARPVVIVIVIIIARAAAGAPHWRFFLISLVALFAAAGRRFLARPFLRRRGLLGH